MKQPIRVLGILVSGILTAFALSSQAVAEPVLRPGLWEYSFDMKSQSGQIEAAMEQARKALESLPPEQRKMIEEQMAARGVGLDLKSYTAKVCVTEEQASRQEFPQPNDDCSQSVVEQADNVLKMKFSCEGNPPTSGEGEIRMLSDKEYRGNITVNTTVNGQPETLQATQTGTWLSEDCGAIKPLS